MKKQTSNFLIPIALILFSLTFSNQKAVDISNKKSKKQIVEVILCKNDKTQVDCGYNHRIIINEAYYYSSANGKCEYK
jgi:hypothetical protein